jgi:hypothetical protein
VPVVVVGLGSLTANRSEAALNPEWTARLPVGSSLSAGLAGMFVTAGGVTYVTGVNGPSSNIDVFTAAYAPDGILIWSDVYNGPGNWGDQARGITLGGDGFLYVTGNTPGAGKYANVLLLKYDPADGTLLKSIQYSSAPFTSEYGASVAVDAQGNAYVGGGTVGDGADGMLLKFDASGVLQWRVVWDGPAFAPYSQDHVRQVALDPDGNLVAMIYGVMSSQHPDYVVTKYAPADGTVMWETHWGSNGEDSPRTMRLDSGGDVFVTGTALFNGSNHYGTIRLRGGDGQLLWEAFDRQTFHDSPSGLALDGRGGVYVTGSTDPDGDRSNQNENFYSVKRDATTGGLLWTHSYGDNCRGCQDLASDVIADSADHVFIVGYTVSAPYSGDMILFQLDARTGVEQDRGIVTGDRGEEVVFPAILRFDGGENLFIGGEFYNANTGAIDVTVMKYASLAGSPVRPESFEVTRGVLVGGYLPDLFDADDAYVEVDARRPTEIAAASVEIEVTGTAPGGTPGVLEFTVEAASSGTPARQQIQMFNYVTARWEVVDERQASATDTTVRVSITQDAARFVDPDTFEVRTRVGYLDFGITFPAWGGRFDEVFWTVFVE